MSRGPNNHGHVSPSLPLRDICISKYICMYEHTAPMYVPARYVCMYVHTCNNSEVTPLTTNFGPQQVWKKKKKKRVRCMYFAKPCCKPLFVS